ncbi:MAG: IPT/TIG domain-containing protein [Nitrospirota bacterium]|nr:IPT/TIG domain-containing protein [Nitrospirota bacterium]
MLLGIMVFGSGMPVWADLFPDVGPPGTTVTIGGENFGTFQSTGVNRVEFNGVPALIQLWETDLVMVKVPLAAKSGLVTVMAGEAKQAVGTFDVKGVKIHKLTPPEAEPGSVLVIEGENFGSTAGSRDPNTMFGVNRVVINGILAQIRKWRSTRIEVTIPANATSGEVVVQLASSDPLPDGSCCAPVEYVASNAMPVELIPHIDVQPQSGPIGTKVVLSGQDFGQERKPGDQVFFNGKLATISQWSSRVVVVHVPLHASSGPVVLKHEGRARNLGEFSIVQSQVEEVSPISGPIGTLIQIKGKDFGLYSEAGSTAYAFDFDPGQNRVEIGGVPAIIHRWQNTKIDAWVPYSAKSGPIVIKRGGTTPKTDGTCCAEKSDISLEAGHFTVQSPTVTSYGPDAAGLDEVVTIKGNGFGEFLKIAEHTRLELHSKAHSWQNYQLGPDVSRSEVFVNGMAAHVVSWADSEIQIRVPRRPVFGLSNAEGFIEDPTKGEIVVRRGSWDLLDNGKCCSEKKWVDAVAGKFTILRRGLPHKNYFHDYTQDPP